MEGGGEKLTGGEGNRVGYFPSPHFSFWLGDGERREPKKKEKGKAAVVKFSS